MLLWNSKTKVVDIGNGIPVCSTADIVAAEDG